MKQVRLKKMILHNFKGIKDFEIPFNERTKIFGDNATGKTTLVDAFTWLLFGKDSTGRKDFAVKTYDEDNQVVHKLDHEVKGIFDVEGEDIVLNRILREKWVTKRGSQEPELQGNETLFYWNDVPMQSKEYQDKVDSIILENTFKLITSPLYFNSLKWQERREILTSIAGNISDQEIASTRLDFSALFNDMGKKSLDEYKKELAAKKKKLKDDLKLIPARIDEVTRNTPESKDWDWIEDEIKTVSGNITIIEEQLQDSSKAYGEFLKEKQDRQNQIHRLKSRISDIEFDGNKKFSQNLREKTDAIAGAKNEIDKINQKVQDDIEEIERLKKAIAGYREEQNQLREQWEQINSDEFPGFGDESQFICPTCKQALPSDDIEAKKAELKSNFEKQRAQRLLNISEQGKAINPAVEKYEKRISELESFNYEAQIRKHEQVVEEWEKKHLTSVQSILSTNDEYQAAKEQLKGLQELPEDEYNSDVEESSLKLKKSGLQQTLDGLKKDLALKEQIEHSEARKKELLNKEKELASQLSELEQTEFTIQEFTRAKVDMLESKINGLFKDVRFRMFDYQINGGLVETCDTLVNTNGKWVPWPDSNTAGRINAGIEIINIISSHYKQTAPIWIDGAESITNIRDTNSQLIELYVSESHKQLEVA